MLAEIVIFDGVDELDVIGVHEVLARARRLGAELEPRLVVLPQRSRTVTAAHGVRLWAESALSQSADLLVIPGGGWSLPQSAGIRREIDSGELPAAVARAHQRGAIIASVCTGAMALAAAGLLQGRRATTHRSALAALGAAGAITVPDRVVDQGSLVTSGGVTSGLDLGLHLVGRDYGWTMAAQVARDLEHPWVGAEAPATTLHLVVFDHDLDILRLGPQEEIPDWVQSASWVSVTRTPQELSIVYATADGPHQPGASGPWRALSVEGPLEHDVIGVLAQLSRPLAIAGIPIFVISTFDTDHLLVRSADLAPAIACLTGAGYEIS